MRAASTWLMTLTMPIPWVATMMINGYFDYISFKVKNNLSFTVRFMR